MNIQMMMRHYKNGISGQCKNLRGNICKNPIFA